MSHVDAVNDALAIITRLTEETRRAEQEVKALHEEHSRQTAGDEVDLAEARRRGDLGPEWRTLQMRIDLNQTTFLDIVCGLDHSREAAAIRAAMETNLKTLRGQLEDIALANPELSQELRDSKEALALAEQLTFRQG